jgi:hypothetical protein
VCVCVCVYVCVCVCVFVCVSTTPLYLYTSYTSLNHSFLLRFVMCINHIPYHIYTSLSQFQARDFEVVIEAPSMNSRRITADVIIDAPIETVWRILSDYNNLATHVPNLIQSYLVPVPNSPEKLRLFQEGAQKIIGFDFRYVYHNNRHNVSQ